MGMEQLDYKSAMNAGRVKENEKRKRERAEAEAERLRRVQDPMYAPYAEKKKNPGV